MANYNGLVAALTLNGSTVSQTLGGASISNVVTSASVPSKFFSHGQFAISVAGISGNIGVQIIGAVGGATYVIAGRTNISASGGFPIPCISYTGTSGTFTNIGIPRPAFVSFQGNTAGTVVGFTASVFLCAEYN
jgi:hypothetical protein